jgi:hypothetical protein
MKESEEGGVERRREEFKDGVAEPKHPSEFLLQLLNETPNDPYTNIPQGLIPEGESADSMRARLPEQREKIHAVFRDIEDICANISERYMQTCSEYGLRPKNFRVYVVGGRIRQKPLLHTSDVDVVFTTEDQKESLQPDYTKDSEDLRQRKQNARTAFIKDLEDFFEERGLTEKMANTMTAFLVEPKGYGASDADVRSQWRRDITGLDDRRGVLVYTKNT